MKAFARLYQALDSSTSTIAKQTALKAYLQHTAPEDAAWAVYFLAGGKPRQLVPRALLRGWAQQSAGLPEWLFDECHEAVGDLAETMALVVADPNDPQPADKGLAAWMTEDLLPLRGLDAPVQLQALTEQWQRLPEDGRLIYFKLITGALRVGVSKLQVTQALAGLAGLDPKLVAQRLMGYADKHAQPQAADYLQLIEPAEEGAQRSPGQPYPFFLAHPWQQTTAAMQAQFGAPEQWVIDWKWDGIRAQLVCRQGQVFIWSRGEELLSDRFPELQAMGEGLHDGTVIDGEILAWEFGAQVVEPAGGLDLGRPRLGWPRLGRPRPFADLQQRIGRKTLPPKLLREMPVILMAYDLLEDRGEDLREQPLAVRRQRLEALVQAAGAQHLLLSSEIQLPSWEALDQLRAESRQRGVEGMMLKQRQGGYGVGRTKDVGLWWKWKIDPLSVDAVLIYAQRGHGRRASLYSDYTFALWNAPPGTPDRQLVPFAKAYSGLTDAEMARVDARIRKTTLETFGPVRSVTPSMVFELGFEGIARSRRHKSGVALRFPRMLRMREDKPVEEADCLATLLELLPPLPEGAA